jgi:hypothetical protein
MAVTVQLQKRKSGREPQVVWHQDDLIGGKPSVAKSLTTSPPRVEAGLNTSTVALRVVGDDEREPSAWGYKYGNLAFRVGGVSNLR